MRHHSDTRHNSTSVVKALKQFRDRNYNPGVPSDRNFGNVPAYARDLVLNDPFAFLVGASFDRGMLAGRAWELPYQIKRKGILNPSVLASMTYLDLEHLIDSLPKRPRYGSIKGAKTLKDAAMLAMKFGGDASAIWRDASPTQVSRRIQSIYGVGPGIAYMAIRILRDRLGVFAGQENEIDVKADVHVMRVFKRTGLTLSESESEAVNAARRLNPQYPAELDWPAWIIGQEWCRPSNPNCPSCPLTAVCRKRLD